MIKKCLKGLIPIYGDWKIHRMFREERGRAREKIQELKIIEPARARINLNFNCGINTLALILTNVDLKIKISLFFKNGSLDLLDTRHADSEFMESASTTASTTSGMAQR